MCFVPQRRASLRHADDQKCSENSVFCTFWLWNALPATAVLFFRHPNFQKSSENGVFLTFWLGNALRATTAYIFWTSQLPKMVRTRCLLYILTWTCVSCTFSFLISPHGSAPAALASLLFDPPDQQIIGKTKCFATSLTFRGSVPDFFQLFLFLSFDSTLLFCAFHLSILWEVWLLTSFDDWWWSMKGERLVHAQEHAEKWKLKDWDEWLRWKRKEDNET